MTVTSCMAAERSHRQLFLSRAIVLSVSVRSVRRSMRTCVRVAAAATILHADLDAFYASVEQRDDPRLRSRPVIVGGGRGARRQLRGEGVRASARRWAAAGAPAVPATRSSSSRGSRPTSEASRAVFEIFEDTTPLVEGLSIDEAFLDVRGLERISGTPAGDRRAAAAPGPDRGRPAASRSASRARSSSPRWRAAWRSPTGCSSCPPAGELRVPAPAARRAAVGRRRRRPRRKLHARGIATVGRGGAAARGGCWSAIVGRAAGRQLHALAHNRDPRRVQVGRRRRSIGSQRALGRRAALAGRARRGRWSASSTASRGGCARPGASCRTVVIRLRFDDFTRATRSHTLPRGHGADGHDPRHGARAAARGDAADRGPGPHAPRHRARQPRPTTAPSSSPSPSTAGARRRSTRRSTTSASASARPAITRAVLLGRDQGIDHAAAPGLMRARRFPLARLAAPRPRLRWAVAGAGDALRPSTTPRGKDAPSAASSPSTDSPRTCSRGSRGSSATTRRPTSPRTARLLRARRARRPRGDARRARASPSAAGRACSASSATSASRRTSRRTRRAPTACSRARRAARTGLYAAISARGLYAGTGYYRMARDQLERFRAAVADDGTGPALAEATVARRSATASRSPATRCAPRRAATRATTPGSSCCAASRSSPAPRCRATAASPATPRSSHAAASWRAAAPLNAWLDEHVGASTLPPDDRRGRR